MIGVGAAAGGGSAAVRGTDVSMRLEEEASIRCRSLSSSAQSSSSNWSRSGPSVMSSAGGTGGTADELGATRAGGVGATDGVGVVVVVADQAVA